MANELIESGSGAGGGSNAPTFSDTSVFSAPTTTTDNTSTTSRDTASDGSSFANTMWGNDGLNNVRQLNDMTRGSTSDSALGLPQLTIEDPAVTQAKTGEPIKSGGNEKTYAENPQVPYYTTGGETNGGAFPSPPADRHLASSPIVKSSATPDGPIGAGTRSGMASLVRAQNGSLGESIRTPQNSDINPAIADQRPATTPNGGLAEQRRSEAQARANEAPAKPESRTESGRQDARDREHGNNHHRLRLFQRLRQR